MAEAPVDDYSLYIRDITRARGSIEQFSRACRLTSRKRPIAEQLLSIVSTVIRSVADNHQRLHEAIGDFIRDLDGNLSTATQRAVRLALEGTKKEMKSCVAPDDASMDRFRLLEEYFTQQVLAISNEEKMQGRARLKMRTLVDEMKELLD